MSLVVLSGYPLSGKTALARRLNEELPKHDCTREIHLVLDPDSNSIMKDSMAERTSRAALKSTVQRLVQPNRIVIVDSTNYLQSFRYELYCLAKECKVGFLIVRCAAKPETVLERNRHSTNDGLIFDEAALRNAMERYEEPKERSKWDLHFLYDADDGNSLSELCKSIVLGRPLKSNRSTQSTPQAEPSFFSELDRITKTVTETMLKAIKAGMQPGDRVPVGDSPYSVTLPEHLTAQSLASIRRQFANYLKLNPVDDVGDLTGLFVDFVNHSFK